ncbi:phosphatase PAP2 family protein [Qipengyuania aurantiaca]|uniref:Phosphatase PAP2 family protein n=1 Tax=Qipengyuania aurantiaca TaxID=2867233 RepID=A0ABX8ZTA6_9SPHN|nr:phosphatase PAP2 family protein [Qipengyuania aurantiaca]QZD90393.1 phosphatase PAP2 family protein [Qipengyuania aurantiaca]
MKKAITLFGSRDPIPEGRDASEPQSPFQTEKFWGYAAVAFVAVIAASVPVPENNRSEAFIILSLIGMALIFLGRIVLLAVRRHPSPFHRLLLDIRAHWLWVLTSCMVFLSLAITLETGSGIKKSIPEVRPFYADPFLIDVDRWIFGTDPWRITHALCGWATPAIAWLYDGWHFVHIGLAVWIALSFDEMRKIRFAICFQLSWLLLGGLTATLASSVGPIMVADFYADNSFLPLIAELQASVPRVLAVKDILISTMDNPTLISGISAMPSMHVAIAVLFALWLQSYRKPILTVIGWAYALLIYLGSIHLGWHYATDGPVSAIFVLLVWWVSGKGLSSLSDRLETPEKPASVLS